MLCLILYWNTYILQATEFMSSGQLKFHSNLDEKYEQYLMDKEGSSETGRVIERLRERESEFRGDR